MNIVLNIWSDFFRWMSVLLITFWPPDWCFRKEAQKNIKMVTRRNNVVMIFRLHVSLCCSAAWNSRWIRFFNTSERRESEAVDVLFTCVKETLKCSAMSVKRQVIKEVGGWGFMRHVKEHAYVERMKGYSVVSFVLERWQEACETRLEEGWSEMERHQAVVDAVWTLGSFMQTFLWLCHWSNVTYRNIKEILILALLL